MPILLHTHTHTHTHMHICFINIMNVNLNIHRGGNWEHVCTCMYKHLCSCNRILHLAAARYQLHEMRFIHKFIGFTLCLCIYHTQVTQNIHTQEDSRAVVFTEYKQVAIRYNCYFIHTDCLSAMLDNVINVYLNSELCLVC